MLPHCNQSRKLTNLWDPLLWLLWLFISWCDLLILHVASMSLRMKALPGAIAKHAKLRRLIRDCKSRKITLLAFITFWRRLFTSSSFSPGSLKIMSRVSNSSPLKSKHLSRFDSFVFCHNSHTPLNSRRVSLHRVESASPQTKSHLNNEVCLDYRFEFL